ncbi:MAG: ATP synthase subunit I [Burkholderiaceae bacterium]
MPMHELPALSAGTFFAGLAGLVLGAFFFGSLWWNLRRTLASPPSVGWHLIGLLVRMAVTLLGFYAVGAGQWERLLACLVGFLVARFAATRMARSWERRQTDPATASAKRKTPEVGHASEP